MGAKSRTKNSSLVAADVEAKLWNEPQAFEFFQAVRLLENLLNNGKEVGRFAGPDQEIVRFKQNTSLSFPTADIFSLVANSEGPSLMTISFMGLLGVQGVLPRTYTEVVLARAPRDTVLSEFLDLFHHRLVSLFYIGWRKYRSLERTGDQPDSLEQALYSLIGLGTRRVRDRQLVADPDWLFYSGLLAQQPRSASALESLVSNYFEIPVRVEQFTGAWYKLDADALCTLDDSESETRQVGIGAIVGDEVWAPQAKVRLVLGPLARKRYLDFLPTGQAYARLRAMVRFFSDEIDFEAQLVLNADETPSCILGETSESAPRLGWLSWASTRKMTRNPSDTVILL